MPCHFASNRITRHRYNPPQTLQHTLRLSTIAFCLAISINSSLAFSISFSLVSSNSDAILFRLLSSISLLFLSTIWRRVSLNGLVVGGMKGERQDKNSVMIQNWAGDLNLPSRLTTARRIWISLPCLNACEKKDKSAREGSPIGQYPLDRGALTPESPLFLDQKIFISQSRFYNFKHNVFSGPVHRTLLPMCTSAIQLFNICNIYDSMALVHSSFVCLIYTPIHIAGLSRICLSLSCTSLE